jgi:hypothetical protein
MGLRRAARRPSSLSAKKPVSSMIQASIEPCLDCPGVVILDRDAVHLGAGAHVRCVGKGRKERCVPPARDARH